MMSQLMDSDQVEPCLCVGIHAGKDRKNEYGTAGIPDYGKRSTKGLMKSS